MSNFRCERLFVMLDDPVPGLDHLKAIDPVRLSELYGGDNDSDADIADLPPLSTFVYAPFDRPKWRAAAKGLKTVRGLIEYYEQCLQRGSDSFGHAPDAIARKIETLKQLEEVLDAADTRDRKFYLLARDLD